jgi:hypothetical protein
MAGQTYTRKTHIVRVFSDIPPSEFTPTIPYVDIEVLDAISFKRQNGETMVLNMPKSGVKANIIDNTGDGNGKTTSGATRLSHMTKIQGTIPGAGGSGGSGIFNFDYEVADTIAFTEENGKVWVLDMPSNNSSPFVSTDGSGAQGATRNTHLEQIYQGGVTAQSQQGNSCNPVGSIVIERVDYLGFKTANGETMIVKCPSADDGVSGPRAPTFMEPPDYDPTNPNSVPPSLADSGDANIYFKFFGQFFPATPPQSQTTNTVLLTFFGFEFPLPLTPGETFVPGGNYENDGLGFMSFQLSYIGTPAAAAAYAQGFVGGHVGITEQGTPITYQDGEPIDVYLSGVLVNSVTETFPGSPAFTQPYSIATKGFSDTTSPSGNDPNNIKMGPLWWIRKFGP